MINTMNVSYAIFFSELCIENTRVIFDEYVPIMARLKANELLGRMYGDYLQKVIIKEQQTDMPTIQFNLDDDD